MRVTALLQASTLTIAALLAAACGEDGTTVGVVAPTLDFGLTDCGTTAVPRLLQLTNESGESFTYTTSLALGADSPYIVTPSTGSVLARQQLSLTVTSKGVPSVSATTDNLYGDTLTITTDSGDVKIYEVAINQTARGVRLEASTAAVNFATALKFGTSAESPVTITNVGNAPGEVTLESSLIPFSSVPAGPQAIAAGAALATSIKFSPGHNAENVATMRVVPAGSAVCSEPVEITVSGTGDAVGLAAQAVPSVARTRPRETGGVNAICTRLTNGLVACGGTNFVGMRGAPDAYITAITPTQTGKGGTPVPMGSGGIAELDIVNVVQTKDGYLDEVVDLVSGTASYCALRQNGEVWCWGDYEGRGGRELPDARAHFVASKVRSGVASVSSGYLTRCYTASANNTMTCASKRSASSGAVPTASWTVAGATSIATNGGNSYAVVGGEVYTFGLNSSGERGYTADVSTAGAVIPDFTGVTSVVAGGRVQNRSVRYACARKNDGTASCWGDNRHGQLGDNTTGNQTAPVQVLDAADSLALENISELTAGFSHMCARLADGTVACWGRGSEGQVGPASNSQNNPMALVIPELSGVQTLTASGTRATCAVLTNHAVRCWGHMLGAAYQTPTALFAFEP